jgi:hypothetical protein
MVALSDDQQSSGATCVPGNRIEKPGDIQRIVLPVTIQRNDLLARCVKHTAVEGRTLAATCLVRNDHHSAMAAQLPEQGRRFVTTAVINKHDLGYLAVAEHAFDFMMQPFEVSCFFEDRDHDGYRSVDHGVIRQSLEVGRQALSFPGLSGV